MSSHKTLLFHPPPPSGRHRWTLLWVLLGAFGLGTPTFAQGIALDVTGTAGGFHAGPAGSVAYTMGEVCTESLVSGAGSANQGFQQVFENLLVSRLLPVETSIQVFPNPSLGPVHIRGAQGLDLRITDLQGRMVHQQSDLAPEAQLNLHGLARGPYFLCFYSPVSHQKSFVKLIKR